MKAKEIDHGLELLRKGVAFHEASSGVDPQDVRLRRGLADSYAALAAAYVQFALEAKTAREQTDWSKLVPGIKRAWKFGKRYAAKAL